MTKPSTAPDAAWASLQTPLTVDQLLAFCRDVERLLRINPYLEFSGWERIGENRYRISGRNLSQVPAFDFEYLLTVESSGDGMVIHYDQGLKKSTALRLEPTPAGSRLTITEDYSNLSEAERHARLHEVDRSLVQWAHDLQAYLILWQRWSWLRPWRWYMRRVWQPLKPSARRIVYMFIWISIVEVALILLGAAIYFVEYA